MEKKNERTLTDADVEAIAEKVLEAGTKRFYFSAGKGLWGLAWRAILLILLGLAAYGMNSGRH